MTQPPICVRCQLEMRCKKNNFLVADEATLGFPATYWLGDLWECPCCEAQIVTGFGAPMTGQPDPAYQWGAPLSFRCEVRPGGAS